MANKFQVLSSFSHITTSIDKPVKALVSVQYPTLSGLDNFKDSIKAIFKQKRAVYLALSEKQLVHIQTVGTSVVSKKTFNFSQLEAIHFNKMNLSEVKSFSIPTVTLSVKEKKGKKETVNQYEFSLFPSLFYPNLVYSEKLNEITQFVEMRQEILSTLQNWQQKLEDQKVLEAINMMNK